MKEASSEARKAATLPISSGRPQRCNGSAERIARVGVVAVGVAEVLCGLCRNIAGADCVHSHALGAVVQRQSLSQPEDTVFSGRVGSGINVADKGATNTCDRGNVDHRSVSTLNDRWQCLAAGIVRSGLEKIDHVLPGVRPLYTRWWSVSDAGHKDANGWGTGTRR
jgi:hypothetical protein